MNSFRAAALQTAPLRLGRPERVGRGRLLEGRGLLRLRHLLQIKPCDFFLVLMLGRGTGELVAEA